MGPVLLTGVEVLTDAISVTPDVDLITILEETWAPKQITPRSAANHPPTPYPAVINLCLFLSRSAEPGSCVGRYTTGSAAA